MYKYIFFLLIISCFFTQSCKSDNNSSIIGNSKDCKEFKLDLSRKSKQQFYAKLEKIKDDNKMVLIDDMERLKSLDLKVYSKTMGAAKERKYSVYVIDDFLKQKDFNAKLFAVINHSLPSDNMKYIMKTYDNTGNKIAHLDLAGYFGPELEDFGGSISCEDKILIYNYTHKKLREYDVDGFGKMELLVTKDM